METEASDKGTSQPIRVFLLDDHEIVRRGVRDMLEAEGDIKVVGEAGTASVREQISAAAVPRTCHSIRVRESREHSD